MTAAAAITRLNAALEGRYHIESELGEGGMATVYLADDGVGAGFERRSGGHGYGLGDSAKGG